MVKITNEFFRPTLTEAEVIRIVELRKQGYGPYKIAKLIGANHSTVKHVVQGRSWRHITGGRVAKGLVSNQRTQEEA
jgi:IS30 family transposase